MTPTFAIALDIGGTKIAAGCVDTAGSVSRRVQTPTPAGDAEAVWAAVASAVSEMVAGLDLRDCAGIGVGTAGPIDLVEGRVSPVNIAGWRGFPILAELRRLVPGHQVHLAGDAVCVAVAEHWVGAGQGCEAMVAMVVSTGVGGGLVLGGRPYVGASGNAGHLGHISVDLDGPVCACGGIGCVEAIASGRSIAAWAVEQGFPGEPTAVAVADAARRGDAVAVAAFDRAGRAIGSMLAGVATSLDVHVAVIGGGVAASGDVLLDPIRRAIDTYAGLGYARPFEVRPAALGGDAGLVGAAALALTPG